MTPPRRSPEGEAEGEAQPAALEGLRHKYRELHAMRAEREVLEARGVMRFEGAALADRSARGRALARLFPGVLRELDACDARTLAARLGDVEAALARVRSGAAALPAPWIAVMIDFHALWRDGLAIRAWLRDRGADAARPDAPLLAALRQHLASAGGFTLGPEAVDADLLTRHFAVRRGSLAPWVWAEVARRQGLSVAEARALAFPPGS